MDIIEENLPFQKNSTLKRLLNSERTYFQENKFDFLYEFTDKVFSAVKMMYEGEKSPYTHTVISTNLIKYRNILGTVSFEYKLNFDNNSPVLCEMILSNKLSYANNNDLNIRNLKYFLFYDSKEANLKWYNEYFYPTSSDDLIKTLMWLFSVTTKTKF